MKRIVLLLVLCVSFSIHAQKDVVGKEISEASKLPQFKEVTLAYSQGKYQRAIQELSSLELITSDKSQLGLIAYWKGVCFNRLQDFANSITSFDKSLQLGYVPVDLNYEYGQALYAADMLQEARLQFRESIKKKFKRAVSLYYIGFISKELGEKKKAVAFLKAIEKLDESEAKDVRQASEFQIADIYLEQVEKHPDAFRAVESYVIPQYELALSIDRESSLAPKIQRKILELQQKYDLILFKLRNGRDTLVPPYFLRFAAEVGRDSNVTFSPTGQEVAESEKSSLYAKTDAMGRYTFYYGDMISISPEMRFSYTRYLNRIEEIYRNDNYILAPALRNTYEHTLWKKPASFILDYEYNDARRDIEAKEELDFAFRSHTMTIGERFNFFSWGESTVRLKYRVFDSYDDNSDSRNIGLSWEQLKSFPVSMLLLFASYDQSRVEDESYDNDSLNLRADWILPSFRGWFSPSVGLGFSYIDPINDAVRGTEYLINPSLRLSRSLGKNLRSTLRYDFQNYKSDDEDNFAYRKHVYALELEYVF
jgi:tetratricopeptide (TPR) repeat protein